MIFCGIKRVRIRFDLCEAAAEEIQRQLIMHSADPNLRQLYAIIVNKNFNGDELIYIINCLNKNWDHVSWHWHGTEYNMLVYLASKRPNKVY